MAPTPAEIEFLEAARALLSEKQPSPVSPSFYFSNSLGWTALLGRIEYKVFRLLGPLGPDCPIFPPPPVMKNPASIPWPYAQLPRKLQ